MVRLCLAATLAIGLCVGLATSGAQSARARSETILYVSSTLSQPAHILAYHPEQRFPEPFETISDVKVGVELRTPPEAVDATGTLYVASEYGIAVYPPGDVNPSTTISTTDEELTGIATDAAANLYVTVIGSPDELLEYAAGQTKPFAKIKLTRPSYVALDGSGDIFVTEQRPSANGVVAEIPSGQNRAKALHLQGVTYPVGIAINPDGDLYVSDGQLREVLAFHPGQTKPFSLIAAHGANGNIAFDASGNLYVAEGALGQVAVYKPGTKKASKLVRIGLALTGAGAVAAYPPYLCCTSSVRR